MDRGCFSIRNKGEHMKVHISPNGPFFIYIPSWAVLSMLCPLVSNPTHQPRRGRRRRTRSTSFGIAWSRCRRWSIGGPMTPLGRPGLVDCGWSSIRNKGGGHSTNFTITPWAVYLLSLFGLCFPLRFGTNPSAPKADQSGTTEPCNTVWEMAQDILDVVEAEE